MLSSDIAGDLDPRKSATGICLLSPWELYHNSQVAEVCHTL